MSGVVKVSERQRRWCCGGSRNKDAGVIIRSGGMFVQSEELVEANGGQIGDISLYGQESNHTTWRLAKMNLAIRNVDGRLGKERADSFHHDGASLRESRLGRPPTPGRDGTFAPCAHSLLARATGRALRFRHSRTGYLADR